MAQKKKPIDKYVSKKIDHLRRMGLVSGNSSGLGPDGGACPDWLKQQKENDSR